LSNNEKKCQQLDNLVEKLGRIKKPLYFVLSDWFEQSLIKNKNKKISRKKIQGLSNRKGYAWPSDEKTSQT